MTALLEYLDQKGSALHGLWFSLSMQPAEAKQVFLIAKFDNVLCMHDKISGRLSAYLYSTFVHAYCLSALRITIMTA